MVYMEYKDVPGVQRSYHLAYYIQMNQIKSQFISILYCVKVILNYITLTDEKKTCNVKAQY